MRQQPSYEYVCEKWENNERDYIPVESDAIQAVAYSAAEHTLYVRLVNQKEYCYHAVPNSVVREWLSSESLGRYYNAKIRRDFHFTRMF